MFEIISALCEDTKMGLSKKHLLTEDEVVIEAKQLSVWTPEQKPWWRKKPTKLKTMILNNVFESRTNLQLTSVESTYPDDAPVRSETRVGEVTGCMKTGEFVAVIGPSGAGKTTFLVALAGRSNLPSAGIVTLNGTNVRDLQRGVIEIVPQFEIFMETLTVMEHLIFMTEMLLGSIKKSENKIKLDALIDELKLKMHVNTCISSLSGGERRLLSLTTCLLSNPQVLICDEPTTGLDSFNASRVVGVLKRLSILGTVVICSVHQPSSDLFKEFNTITLMSDGEIVFHGSQEDCKALFESVNLYCPKNYNPAEFYIKVVSVEAKEGNYLERIKQNYSLQRSYGYSYSPIVPYYQIRQRHWCKQVQLLLWRCSRNFKSNLKGYFSQLIFNTIMSLLIVASCYAGITGTTQRGVQDIRGFLWLVVSEICFNMSYTALFTFEAKLGLFLREIGVYSPSAYYINIFLCSMPLCIVWPVVYVGVVGLTVPLPNHLVTMVEFVVVLIAAGIASTAYGLSMGVMFASTQLMGDIVPCVDLPMFVMSGAFMRLSSLPLWLYPVKYISHFYYSMDALSNVYWRQIDFIECPTNATSLCYKDGISVLTETGYSTHFILQDSIGLLLITILWNIFGFIGLKREERKGYTY